MLSCDRILLTSNWILDTLTSELTAVSARVARDFAERAVVVGLPIDKDAIDEARSQAQHQNGKHRIVLFNHSMSAGKRPDLALN